MDQWETIQDCVPLLKPLELMTEKLLAEKYPVLSKVNPLVREIHISLQHRHPSTRVGSVLQKFLIESIRSRLGHCERYKRQYESNVSNFFPRKFTCNNNKIYMDDSHIFCNYEAIFHKVSTIFNTLLPTPSKMLYTKVVNFPDSASEHIMKTLIHCHLQNGAQVQHPLQSQAHSSWRVPDLGCECDEEEQSIPFLQLPNMCASWCEAGHCCEGEGRLSCSS
jgi:hypothetical protein